MNEIGIIGIGNPLRRDDGIGIYLLNKLIKSNFSKKEKISFIDGGTGGFTLIHRLADFKKILIIDAIDFNNKPGETIFIKYKENHNYKLKNKISTHENDIFKIIELSKFLNHPTEIFLFGIQPKDLSYGTNFSDIIDKKLDLIFKKLTSKIMEI